MKWEISFSNMHDSNPDQTLKNLAPNQQTKFTAIVNGILNGATIGSVPMIGATVWAEFGRNGVHKEIPKFVKKGSYISTVAGVVLGAVYGLQESERIKEYRMAIANTIGGLEDRIANMEAEKKALLAGTAPPPPAKVNFPMANDNRPDSKISDVAAQERQAISPSITL
ncbi:MAG: hypothetical protein U1E36_02295 [Rickettsiales bacterium]